ncbi:hypothetical protein ABZ883_18520 [Streptomyces sp. NPDC046977]|uniref:hypothetical protein n=1 Tax=Streptomyces sp. NPDC046977 TaxID=3154703 RepID=UPI0033E51EF6
MRVETATEPGTPDRPNEDFVAIAMPASGGGGSLVLLDGVTPPDGPTGCRHTVPWYVSELGGSMIELSVSPSAPPLAECLAQAVARTADTHRATCDLYHRRTPQATVVAVRWNADTVEHLVLSDSELLIEDASGAVDAVLDDRLDRLPEPVPALRAAVRALPRGSEERARAAAVYAEAVEALRNAEGGFFTAAADPGVAARAVTGVRPRSSVRAVAALTDGATRLADVFGETDRAGLVALLRKAGPDELVRRVRAAESADPDRTRFPRGKKSDDATAVFVELQGY